MLKEDNHVKKPVGGHGFENCGTDTLTPRHSLRHTYFLLFFLFVFFSSFFCLKKKLSFLLFFYVRCFLCLFFLCSFSQMKSENKTVAVGTSKINYMDFRITVAWCKRVDMPLEKINKSLLQKFPWAMETESVFNW